jgi:hypothetical protein
LRSLLSARPDAAFVQLKHATMAQQSTLGALPRAKLMRRWAHDGRPNGCHNPKKQT